MLLKKIVWTGLVLAVLAAPVVSPGVFVPKLKLLQADGVAPAPPPIPFSSLSLSA